jgi:hypothetical protein
MDALSDSDIPAFRRHVTIYLYIHYIQQTGRTLSDTEAASNTPNICEAITTVVRVYFKHCPR